MTTITLNSCRVCLINTGTESLFNKNVDGYLIADIITSCTNVEINKDDGYFEFVCGDCLNKINIIHNFQKDCEISDNLMRNCYEDGVFIESKIYQDDFFEVDYGDECEEIFDDDDDDDDDDDEDEDIEESSVELMSNINTKKRTFLSVFEDFQAKIGPDDENIKEEKQENFIKNEDEFLNFTPKVDLWKCVICEETFNLKSELSSHVQTHGDPICSYCFKIFTYDNYLQEHLETHKDELEEIKRYESPFTRTRPYNRTYTGDPDEKKFQCSECDKKFLRPETLREHSRVHKGEKPYICKVCDRRFARQATLFRHALTHEEKQFQCEYCSLRFTVKTSLQNHLRRHTGALPFKCEICEKRFNSTGNFKAHLRIHTGVKRFTCTSCFKQFSENNDLTKHDRIHQGDCKYQCKYCLAKYNKFITYKNHMIKSCTKNPDLQLNY